MCVCDKWGLHLNSPNDAPTDQRAKSDGGCARRTTVGREESVGREGGAPSQAPSWTRVVRASCRVLRPVTPRCCQKPRGGGKMLQAPARCAKGMALKTYFMRLVPPGVA